VVRDRDPFDRTLETLRGRLAQAGPMQGAPLPISALAEELGVSPTPVREVLARLAGEELIVRTPHGYAALLHDPARVAELYELASVIWSPSTWPIPWAHPRRRRTTPWAEPARASKRSWLRWRAPSNSFWASRPRSAGRRGRRRAGRSWPRLCGGTSLAARLRVDGSSRSRSG
jgi:hypothetical protein